MKFKVGDRVKVIKPFWGFEETSGGTIKRIQERCSLIEYVVEFENATIPMLEDYLQLIETQHTLYNWRNYITFDIEVLQEKIDTSNSEMYRGFSEEEYEKIEEHNGTVEELLIWLSKGYVLLEAFAKEE